MSKISFNGLGMKIREDLYDVSEEDIVLEIGAILSSRTLGAFPPSDEELRKIANEWISKNIKSCQEVICKNDTVSQLASSGFSSELVATVAGLLESLSLGTAASPLVILLCKRGLQNLCNEIWKKI